MRPSGTGGKDGGRKLEELAKIAAPAIGCAGGAFTVVGLIYLGMNLTGIARGGGETLKAVAMAVAGLVVVAFAHLYGY